MHMPMYAHTHTHTYIHHTHTHTGRRPRGPLMHMPRLRKGESLPQLRYVYGYVCVCMYVCMRAYVNVYVCKYESSVYVCCERMGC